MNSATVPSPTDDWLALVIGNTRLHWGAFCGDRLISVWHTPHLSRELAARIQSARFTADSWQRVPRLVHSEVDGERSKFGQLSALSPRSLWVASVVPHQTAIWANQRSTDTEKGHQLPAYVADRSQIPLQNIYATLGIDRAINLLGAGRALSWPVLVIDAGTALTFTAGAHQAVVGGAILPGVRLQAQALKQRTADLTIEDFEPYAVLPARWATTTSEAIASGLAYGTISTLQDYLTDWWRQFPSGKAVMTGGDAPMLHALWQQKTPEVASRVIVDSNLMFKGMQCYRSGAMLLL